MEKDIIILKLDYESELVIGKNYKIFCPACVNTK